jgi:hypothetical protein
MEIDKQAIGKNSKSFIFPLFVEAGREQESRAKCISLRFFNIEKVVLITPTHSLNTNVCFLSLFLFISTG